MAFLVILRFAAQHERMGTHDRIAEASVLLEGLKKQEELIKIGIEKRHDLLELMSKIGELVPIIIEFEIVPGEMAKSQELSKNRGG